MPTLEMATARQICAERSAKPPKVDPGLKRDLEHGWLLPYLLEIDGLLWGRWQYWGELQATGKLPDQPIPPIEFSDGASTLKMLERCLDAVPNGGSGSWQGWGSWDYFNYFLDWVLFGFGYHAQREMPQEPHGCEGASNRLYQLFDVGAMLVYPNDYFGDLLSQNQHGKHNGFYPTPHSLAETLARITMGDGDCRDKSRPRER